MHGPAQSHLARTCPAFAALIQRVGPRPALADDGRPPYARLVRAIAHQQLHARAAEAILARFLALFPGSEFPAPELILARPDADLRACGFSFGKIAAIRDIALKTAEGVVPGRAEMAQLDDEAVIQRLLCLRGVGRWTAEMLLMDSGRPDILPVDDFGVREGYRLLHRLPAQPRPKDLAELGRPWGPYRSTAAWYLWRASDEGKALRPAADRPPRRAKSPAGAA